MGFLSGVVTGVALAAGAAAWYMSRSGERFRSEYQVEQRLGELGDRLEARTREIQATLSAQVAEMREGAAAESSTNGHTAGEGLDPATATAAEVAAEAAAEADVATESMADGAEDATSR